MKHMDSEVSVLVLEINSLSDGHAHQIPLFSQDTCVKQQVSEAHMIK